MPIHRSTRLLTSLAMFATVAGFASFSPFSSFSPFAARGAWAEANDNMLYVAPGAACNGATPCYATIQAAVDAAQAGDTIKVATGTYTNPGAYVVRISKPVQLLGGYATANWNAADTLANPTVIDGQNQVGRRGILAEVVSQPVTVTVSGFTVRNTSNVPPQSCAGICMAGVYAEVTSNFVVSNTGGGVGFGGSKGLIQSNVIEFSNTDLFGNNGYGVLIEGSDVIVRNNSVSYNKGRGIIARENSIARIFDNAVIDNDGNGITSSTAGAFWVSGNLIQSNGSRGISSQIEGGFGVFPTVITITNNTVTANSFVGIYLEQTVATSGTISGNIFNNNTFYGAQLGVSDSGVITFANNTVSGNGFGGMSVDAVTGGKANVLTNSIISNGSTGLVLAGGKGNSVLVYGNVIALNRNTKAGDTTNGGGIRIDGGNVRIIRNRISSNAVNGYGGGIFVNGSVNPFFLTQVQLDGNKILTNTSMGLGSGLAIGGGIVTATNDIIARNYAELPAVYVFSGTLAATHWTLADNGAYAVRVFKDGIATISNTIVAGHAVAGFEQSAGGSLNATRILSWNNGAACANSAVCTDVISGDPMFFSKRGIDYHITPGSAAIDAALATGISDDIDGPGRPNGALPDLGADEIGNYTPVIYEIAVPMLMN